MVTGNESNFKKRKVQCVGLKFLNYYQYKKGHNVNLDDDNEKENNSVTFEDDVEFLRSLDPKEWKDQDHYAVLGIKWLRYKASDETIKKAYRFKVLKHHPDKRKAAGEEVLNGDDYFTCISKAWDILGNKERRKSYDSVDPLFDDEVPCVSDKHQNRFFQVFGPVFDRNARWSEKQPVPKLGDVNTPRDLVEKFYSFWFNFESWREFSYLDETGKEEGQDRDERRYIDKQNKVARTKKKKEEMTRIRLLVGNAYECDPRIAKFKLEDKEKKLFYKKAKQEAAKAKKEEEDKIMREEMEKERKVKEEAEMEEKAKQEVLKQEREILKKQMKQKRKTLRSLCASNNYYVKEDSEKVEHMTNVEKICNSFQLEELTQLLEDIELRGRDALLEAIEKIKKKTEEERTAYLAKISSGKGDSKLKNIDWSEEDLELLIKGVNLFPAGTNQRWEVIANFINQHSTSNAQITAKNVLVKAKNLQSENFSQNYLKDIANKKAFDNFEKEKKITKNVEAVGRKSERFESSAEQQGLLPWTAAEQALLEQALKTYGPDTEDRWDKIAACVPGRTKKACMRRYKELAEIIKAKKMTLASMTK